MIVETSYLLYLAISIAITIGVARTLSKNGLVFLVDGLGGNHVLAKSVNHMLVVGFYLVNLGIVNLALRYGAEPTNVKTAIEFLSTKIGIVLLILGAMHLFNVHLINGFRDRFKKDAKYERELDVIAHRAAALSAAEK